MMQRVLLMILIFSSFFVAADDTVLKLYRPFGEAFEQISPVVMQQLSGQCLGQSQLIIREDAWRCQAEGKIFDPCFVRMSGPMQEVICPQSPWVAHSVQINVSVPLNNQNNIPLDMSQVLPWAVELTNGDHCQAVSSNELYDGMPVHYLCGNQHLLVGYLQRCKSTWSMLAKTPGGVTTVEFKKAWF